LLTIEFSTFFCKNSDFCDAYIYYYWCPGKNKNREKQSKGLGNQVADFIYYCHECTNYFFYSWLVLILFMLLFSTNAGFYFIG